MTEAQRQAASAALQAYNAMETTKRRHFDYLSMLEKARTEFKREPSAQEQALLAQLLQDHDDQVKAFAESSAALRRADEAAFTALWTYVGEINRALGVGAGH